MAVRMKDIAEDLGVSIVTVSKAFHDHRDISPATKKRVMDRMRDLNYQPSLHAQGLASGHSFMVGLVVPDLVHAFFAEIAQSLSSVLRKKGFGLVISSSVDDPDLEQDEIELMVRRRVDVLILASCQESSKRIGKVAKEVPLILLDRSFKDLDVPFVGTDDILVGQMATEHLIKAGFRRIAHIGGKKTSTSLGRLQGYRNALSRHKIEVPVNYVIHRKRSDLSGDTTGRIAMEKLLKLRPRPDAVFCYNDPAAIGAINAIIASGLRVPEDIAVIGAGNIRYAESIRVPLSTIDVSSSALGERAGRLALELATKKRFTPAKSDLVQLKLVVRDSSRRVPR